MDLSNFGSSAWNTCFSALPTMLLISSLLPRVVFSVLIMLDTGYLIVFSFSAAFSMTLSAGVVSILFNGGSAFGAGVLGKDNAKKKSLISF